MDFRQHSPHLEQRRKRLYDSSGPINFERHHFPGQTGHYEGKRIILLRDIRDEVLSGYEYMIRRTASAFKHLGKKMGWE